MCFRTDNKFDVYFKKKCIERGQKYEYLGTVVRNTKIINQDEFFRKFIIYLWQIS